MKKIKNLICFTFLLIFTLINIGPIFANDDIFDGGTLPPVVVTAKNRANIKTTKLPTSKPGGLSDEMKKKGVNETAKIPSPANSGECKGIKLNTDFPFIGRCIGLSSTAEGANQTNAFAYMVKAIMKFIITIIMVVSVLMIVAAGVLMTTEGYEKGSYTKGMGMIKTVAQALALLGASGVILKLINPNFFT